MKTPSAGFAPTEAAALLASAPHRLMFFAGAASVLLSMVWWAVVLLIQARGGAVATALPPAWLHAALAQYGMLPPFIFGFLLTVFPRWLGQPALTRRSYVPVFAGVMGGYLLALVGTIGPAPLLALGFSAILAGWLFGLYQLAGVLRRAGRRDLHALSCLAALGVGAAGVALFAGALWGLLPPAAAWFSGRMAALLFLLPVYFTVCHRMIPFFSSVVVGPAYRSYRPGWSLPAVWALLVAHVALDAFGFVGWLWPVDGLLAAVFTLHALRWQPWLCRRPGLLLVLHLAFAWLPLAFALFALQSAGFALYGVDAWGRAPLHALTIGFFGSMLVAMVTRVSQGHSGRPLEMGPTAWFAFAGVQLVAVLRVAAQWLPSAPVWMAVAAFGWLLAFLPWVVRYTRIYWRPRVDGNPG